MTKDEMVGWHHRRNEHEFEQALGVGDGQRILHDGTELNSTNRENELGSEFSPESQNENSAQHNALISTL